MACSFWNSSELKRTSFGKLNVSVQTEPTRRERDLPNLQVGRKVDFKRDVGVVCFDQDLSIVLRLLLGFGSLKDRSEKTVSTQSGKKELAKNSLTIEQNLGYFGQLAQTRRNLDALVVVDLEGRVLSQRVDLVDGQGRLGRAEHEQLERSVPLDKVGVQRREAAGRFVVLGVGLGRGPNGDDVEVDRFYGREHARLVGHLHLDGQDERNDASGVRGSYGQLLASA